MTGSYCRNSLQILGIIPARGGSKGIPRKNMRLLAGKPLIAHTFEAAQSSRTLTRVILTTDDPEITDFGRKSGIEVPFLRPSELAQDDSPTLPVIRHALEFLENTENFCPEIAVLLQPTAPLRQSEDIDNAVRLMIEKSADALVSVAEVPSHFNPHWVLSVDETCVMRPFIPGSGPEKYPRRQILPPAYYRNGAIYAFRPRLVLEQNTLYGPAPLAYIMPLERSANIDTPEDLREAEYRLSRMTVPPGIVP